MVRCSPAPGVRAVLRRLPSRCAEHDARDTLPRRRRVANGSTQSPTDRSATEVFALLHASRKTIRDADHRRLTDPRVTIGTGQMGRPLRATKTTTSLCSINGRVWRQVGAGIADEVAARTLRLTPIGNERPSRLHPQSPPARSHRRAGPVTMRVGSVIMRLRWLLDRVARPGHQMIMSGSWCGTR